MKWQRLAVILMGVFLIPLDFNIVNVSAPLIRAHLGASSAHLQLIIAGYGGAYAVSLITAGRLGDIYGRKRIFQIGVVAFGLTSLLCGLAPSPLMLILFRVLQGISAALIFPQAISFIQTTFLSNDRNLAFGFLSATVGMGMIVGNSLGGFLVQGNFGGLSWRPIFLVNVPIVMMIVPLAQKVLTDNRSLRPPGLDIVGVFIAVLAIALMIVPLTIGRELNWPLWSCVSILGSVFTLGYFYLNQKGKTLRGASPIVATTLFRYRTFNAGLLAALSFFSGLAVSFLLLTIFMQSSLHFSPLKTGLMFCPFGVAFFSTSIFSSKLVPRFGRAVVQFGVAIMAIGVLILALLANQNGTDVSSLSLIIGLIIYGLGQGFAQPPLFGLSLQGIDGDQIGAAGGTFSTIQQVAYAIGVAAIGSVFFGIAGAVPTPESYARSFALTLFLNFALLCLTGLLMFLFPSHRVIAEIGAKPRAERSDKCGLGSWQTD